jgi:anti-sigma factor RsiW
VTCREFTEFLTQYLSDELSAEQRASFDDHLSRCVNCRHYLSQYRETIAAGRAAFDDLNADVPTDIPEELVRAVLNARKH